VFVSQQVARWAAGRILGQTFRDAGMDSGRPKRVGSEVSEGIDRGAQISPATTLSGEVS